MNAQNVLYITHLLATYTILSYKHKAYRLNLPYTYFVTDSFIKECYLTQNLCVIKPSNIITSYHVNLHFSECEYASCFPLSNDPIDY